MKTFKTNRYGDVELLAEEGKYWTVRFINTSNVDTFHKSSVVRGEIRDKTVSLPKPQPRMKKVGDVITSNNFGDMVVLALDGKKCVVQFIETGTTVTAYTDNAYAGKVKDVYAKVSYGVACLGEYTKPPYWKQAYQLWRNMLKRCYSENDPKGYYGKGITVSERWLCFANFLEDIPKLENFEKWIDGHKPNYPRYNLDKDLKISGNKVYCKELCSFVTEFDNKSAGAKNARKYDKRYFKG